MYWCKSMLDSIFKATTTDFEMERLIESIGYMERLYGHYLLRATGVWGVA